jgi:hypothetical protein
VKIIILWDVTLCTLIALMFEWKMLPLSSGLKSNLYVNKNGVDIGRGTACIIALSEPVEIRTVDFLLFFLLLFIGLMSLCVYLLTFFEARLILQSDRGSTFI